MDVGYNLPWFPAWGIKFESPIENLQKIISRFNKIRPNNRWSLVCYDAIASDFHLWSTWISVVTREVNGTMIAKSVDVEFLRVLSGNHQISKAFEISGLTKGDRNAWIVSIPKLSEQVNTKFGHISRNSYLDLDEISTELIHRLGASLLPKRPLPSTSGLERIVIGMNNLNFSSEQKEELLIGAMVLTDL